MLYLARPDDYGLWMGIGGPLGTVYCGVEGSPFSGLWLRSGNPVLQEYPTVEFAGEGVQEPFWPPNLVPAEEVVAIAIRLYTTGKMPEYLQWGDRDSGLIE
jgi:hypothetical protein